MGLIGKCVGLVALLIVSAGCQARRAFVLESGSYPIQDSEEAAWGHPVYNPTRSCGYAIKVVEFEDGWGIDSLAYADEHGAQDPFLKWSEVTSFGRLVSLEAVSSDCSRIEILIVTQKAASLGTAEPMYGYRPAVLDVSTKTVILSGNAWELEDDFEFGLDGAEAERDLQGDDFGF
jgi:hypothetical protein